MSETFTRKLNVPDAKLTVSHALPAAAADVDSATIDLHAANNAALERAELVLNVDACPNASDTTKNITLTVKDSANDSDYTAIASIATLVIPGVASTGTSATERRLRLPSGTRRYLRVNAAVDSGGGTNTAKTFTAKLVF